MIRIVAANLLLCWITTAQAAVVVQHIGANDPATQGWQIYNHGPGSIYSSNDIPDTEAYWAHNDRGTNTGDGMSAVHYPASAVFQDPAGWTATARVKTIYNQAPGSRDQIGVTLYVSDGTHNWVIDLVGGPGVNATWGIYDARPGVIGPLIHAMDVTSNFHTYQLIHDPTSANHVDLYVNGTHVHTMDRATRNSDARNMILFGSGSSADIGEARWAYVALETGVHVQNVSPIPAPLAAMMGVALIGSFILRKAQT